MSVTTAAASQRALSAGAVLALGGGLALYQLTSLVLGPVDSREFHLSLTIPAAVMEEPFQVPAARAKLVLGTLAAPTWAPPAASDRASGRPAVPPTAAPASAPLPTITPAVPAPPVEPKPSTTHPSDKPKPGHND